MNKTVRLLIGILIGLILGSAINMGIVMLGSELIPFPLPLDSPREELEKVIPTLGFEYFVFPFLAHALGTFSGALISGRIGQKRIASIIIGVFFLIGGITNVFMIPAPIAFVVVDIALAYIPMALLGWHFAQKITLKKA